MTLKLGELAQALGARLEGDGSVEISKLNEIQVAASDEISFISNPKYLKYAETTQAAALIVPEDLEIDFPHLIRSANPKQAMLKALQLLNQKPRLASPGVHPSAILHPSVNVPDSAEIGPGVVVEEDVKLGENIIIEANTVIGSGCTIGEGSHLYPNVVLYNESLLGQNCIIHSCAVIGSDGFGFAVEAGQIEKIPQTGNVILGDDVEIGANCAIDRGSIGPTSIGDGTKLDNQVHIAHNVRIGKNCFLTAQVAIAGSTDLGDRVQMGGQSGVIGHLKVGNDVSIATRGGVTHDIPDGTMVSGFPARLHRDELRIEAILKKLPELYKTVKMLEKQLNKD
ncbi:MAG: UDP-3-O-(3-hydroxymyristoyl)glucosamine N-acyltransferase [Candidatus Marinimicrobia bacterium]|nr:UDP-3-O-(3-hydroxymyristoyl)glucosamine N-acyltransferase [Candidatus Neomarinimicrobiota bacterium]MBT3632063.1 UDP-3-O-(3-hydroxymyristoyl)glucosamine N-acyltransferase [Candidatus Neomarinimicrobiota bacterium]MBT3824649.1 UDP-3-O-(3-hydroxymyristoyl)glucosamine N-acyltransferase [Candidatus Neomarinimicrobiota bacterium]MBT4130177.1 UDP-3-O-(3-hydroxymyristoyl)glucosamine N-acyltransferase [Candidatus Neomarinimicrobiota bacterium]MBT4296927.1 UDP-3-O-(3-hydroxymyristoyl)glucosamine N-ac